MSLSLVLLPYKFGKYLKGEKSLSVKLTPLCSSSLQDRNVSILTALAASNFSFCLTNPGVCQKFCWLLCLLVRALCLDSWPLSPSTKNLRMKRKSTFRNQHSSLRFSSLKNLVPLKLGYLSSSLRFSFIFLNSYLCSFSSCL